MAGQRADGKKLIGAYASRGLRDAVDEWLRVHPRKTQTAFILEAIVEKLKLEKIPIDENEVFGDGRRRKPIHKSSLRPRRATGRLAASAGKPDDHAP